MSLEGFWGEPIGLVCIIVGTETTQGFMVGIATQMPSGRIWETQPVQHYVGYPGDTVSRIVLYAGENP